MHRREFFRTVPAAASVALPGLAQAQEPPATDHRILYSSLGDLATEVWALRTPETHILEVMDYERGLFGFRVIPQLKDYETTLFYGAVHVWEFEEAATLVREHGKGLTAESLMRKAWESIPLQLGQIAQEVRDKLGLSVPIADYYLDAECPVDPLTGKWLAPEGFYYVPPKPFEDFRRHISSTKGNRRIMHADPLPGPLCYETKTHTLRSLAQHTPSWVSAAYRLNGHKLDQRDMLVWFDFRARFMPGGSDQCDARVANILRL